MSTPTADGPRIYRGLNMRERAGWVLGLTPLQAVAVLGLGAPVLLSMSSGRWSEALVLLATNGIGVALVVVPVRGRSALRWLADLLMFQLGVAMRWSVWQSRAAAGAAGPRHEPDLPGVLTRLRFPDGPPLRDQGRVCLIHDTVEGRWGATARLIHSGVGMLSDPECERLADRLGTLLIAIGHREVVDRMSLLVRTVPDDGAEYDVWRAAHEDPRAPALARATTDELDDTIGSVSVRTELFVTVSGHRDRAAPAGAGGRAAASPAGPTRCTGCWTASRTS